MPGPIPLTLRAARDWVGDREIDKGRPYAEAGAVSNTVRRGDTLKGNVRGTRDKPYRVWAALRNGRVADADCSCPVGTGRCKHVAALLLAYLGDPGRFQEVQELDAALQGRDKAELIALIKQMIRRVPELESLLAVPLPGGRAKSPPSPDVYRRQAAEVIRESNPWDEWAGEEIADGLENVIQIGEDFEHAGDVPAVAAVYRGVAAALGGEEVDYLADYNADPIGRLADVLFRCLDQTTDAAQREAILRAAFELLTLHGDLGVNADGGDRLDGLLECVTPNERRTLSGWLRQAGRGGRDDYRGRMLAELIPRVDADVMDDTAQLAHFRRYEMRTELVEKQLALGRTAEAVGAARAAKGAPEFLALCDRLVGAGLAADAEQLVRESLGSRHDLTALRWLRDRAAWRGDAAETLRLTERLFDLVPALADYHELKKLAPASGWAKARAKLLDTLRRRQMTWLLIDILLEEGELAEAIRVVTATPHTGRAEAVATAAEADRPADAARIFRTLAERQIELRGRDHYRQACEYLGKVAALSARLGKSAEFRQYLSGLLERHRSLRALQEEVRAAKLAADAPPTAVRKR